MERNQKKVFFWSIYHMDNNNVVCVWGGCSNELNLPNGYNEYIGIRIGKQETRKNKTTTTMTIIIIIVNEKNFLEMDSIHLKKKC